MVATDVKQLTKRSLILPLTVFALTSCSQPGADVKFDRSINVNARETSQAGSTQDLGSIEPVQKIDQSVPRAEYVEGTGAFFGEATPFYSVEDSDEGTLSLTFKNTDIRIVIQAVLADSLGVSYFIDPRVQGTVTLETSGGISKSALRDVLEALLKTKGYALVPTSDGYHILPVNEAPRSVKTISQVKPASASLPGFSVQVVPLKYTRPSEMEKVLQPFAPTGAILSADDSRRLLILAGTSQELTGMLRAVETFDIDKMAGMSFGIYSLNYVEADEIKNELEEIFLSEDNDTGLKFIPVTRINRLIAVSPSRALLRTVESWVERLDLGESAPGRRIYVYQVLNSRAQDLAETLNLIIGSRFGNGFGGGGFGAGGFNNGLGQQNSLNRNQLNRNQNGFGAQNSLQRNGQFNGQFGQDNVRIVPNEENNSIVVMATPSEFAVVENALKQLDVTPRQVLVEVTIAEVGLTDELRYGLQWHFETGDNTVAFGQSPSPAAQFPGFSWLYTNSDNASAVLNALETLSDVRVISSPKILVLNNQSATLQVGDEVPVPTATAVSTNDSNAPIVNSIEYRNTGVILTVTPRINEGGLVMLEVEQEQSNVAETASSGIDAPTIQQRRMSSTVAVQNGSTVALGGLIRTTVSRNNSGIPLLMDIPLLGQAFRTNSLTERRTELVVLLTPRILSNTDEARSVMDYLSKEFEALLSDDENEPAVQQ